MIVNAWICIHSTVIIWCWGIPFVNRKSHWTTKRFGVWLISHSERAPLPAWEPPMRFLVLYRTCTTYPIGNLSIGTVSIHGLWYCCSALVYLYIARYWVHKLAPSPLRSYRCCLSCLILIVKSTCIVLVLMPLHNIARIVDNCIVYKNQHYLLYTLNLWQIPSCKGPHSSIKFSWCNGCVIMIEWIHWKLCRVVHHQG